jgi:acetolactate synthase-1/2/3 large subunit
MKNSVDGGDAILEAIRDLDVDYVLSSPGSEWGPVWEAFANQTVEGANGPTYISCWHETLAVNLAFGYTAVTARMQVVLLHAGAGLLQGSMGIHAANVNDIPMVVMSGESLTYGEDEDFDPGRQWYGSLSIVGGPDRLLEPVTKWSSRITSAQTMYGQIVRAGELAQRTPSGPTYLSVPIEHMMHPWTPPARARKAPPAPKKRPTDADIAEVAAQLVKADYPLVQTEATGRDAAAFKALVELCDLLALPVYENNQGKAANFPKNNKMHQGFAIAPHLDKADVALTVRSRSPWYPPGNSPKNGTVIAIDECPFDETMVHQTLLANAYLEGDVATTLTLLAEACRAAGIDEAKIAERRARLEAAYDARQADIAAELEKFSANSPIHPGYLASRLSAVLPDNTCFVDETTTHRGVMQNHLRWNAPYDYVKVPTGLGQGLGVALGVKLGMPDRTVVSVIGDGGFLYNPIPQSLGVSRDANLPIMIVIFNNGEYRAMKANQLSYYPDGVGKKSDIFLGATINAVEYSQMVEPFGGYGQRVEDPAELDAALEAGLKAVKEGRTAIINVIVSH